MVVGAWATEIEIIPLLELELPIDPSTIKVLNEAIELWWHLSNILIY